MNAIRHFVSSSTGILSIQLPDEYRSKDLEVIILPVQTESKIKNSQLLADAHKIIDQGAGIGNDADFLKEFEASRQDRVLPNRLL